MNKRTGKKKSTRAQRGMTLIEIMVVIAILGMMATVVTVYFVGEQEKARKDSTKIQMHNIEQALDAYKIRYGSFPTTEEGLKALVDKEVMKDMPKDAWGNEFQYFSPGTHGENDYEIISLGRDGKEGGEDADADLGSWNLDEEEE